MAKLSCFWYYLRSKNNGYCSKKSYSGSYNRCYSNSGDTAFAELKVWQDKNSDSISQSNKCIKIDFRRIKSLKSVA